MPKVVQTDFGKAMSQINDLEALNTESQSTKSNHPAHTKLEAKNEKSIGLLRSFCMNKPDDDSQKSDVIRNDIERREKTLEEIMFPNFDEEENANFNISRTEMNTVQLHRTQGTVGNENVTNANQTGKDKLISHPDLDHDHIRQNEVNAFIDSVDLLPCGPYYEDLNTAYQCDSCNKTIKGSVMLQAHQYQKHYENPNIFGVFNDHDACRVCLKLFIGNKSLKAHILRVHCGDRRYPCTMCGKRFKESTHLRKHLSTHTGNFLTILYRYLRQRTLFQITNIIWYE